jgi:hypothetical protein
MNADEAVVAVIEAIEAAGAGYFVVGSLSSNFYGVPRATADADIVVQLDKVSLSDVLARLGPDFRLERQASFETITMTTRHVLEVPSSGFVIELFGLSQDDYDQERFRRRVRVPLLGRQVFVPTAEDVIVTKLFWALGRRRSKDRDDARDVIAVQGDRLDWPYIYSWVDRHGTRELIEEIRGEIPGDR